MTISSLFQNSNFFPNVIFETCDRRCFPGWTICVTSNNESTFFCVSRRIMRYAEYYVISSVIPTVILGYYAMDDRTTLIWWIIFCYFTYSHWKRGNPLLDPIDRIHNSESRSLIHLLKNDYQWQMAIHDKKPRIKPYNEKTSMMVHF